MTSKAAEPVFFVTQPTWDDRDLARIIFNLGSLCKYIMPKFENQLRFLCLWIFMLLCSAHEVSMVEICDNAMDDDGNGLIDLNDPACDCPVAEPVSLIPNPSFEESNCCPVDRSSLHCADTWIQASAATTDYLHSCGWMGWQDLPVPLPLPDGEACIGFRNGRFGRNPNPNWKEYTGACLTSPLKAGTTYKFQFHIGFTNPRNSPPLNVVFFGSTDCKHLPFGSGDERFGCPTNGEGWIKLSSTHASGSNSWHIKNFTVTPKKDIFAIAIGPDCPFAFDTINPYYFLDNLILADVKEFEFVIAPTDHPCAANFSLTIPHRDSLSYQWYRNGIALVGEQTNTYRPISEGSYQILLLGPRSCKLTSAYIHNIPVSETTIRDHLCEGNDYSYRGKELASGGIYRDTLKTADQCDSVVVLDLKEISDTTYQYNVKIFPGEHVTLGGMSFSQPTSENVLLTSSLGCDSLVHLNLDHYQVYIPNAFSPNNDRINDVFRIYGQDDLRRIISLQIFDRWGGLSFAMEDQDADVLHVDWDGYNRHKQLVEGTYVYVVDLLMDDGEIHRRSGTLALIL